MNKNDSIIVTSSGDGILGDLVPDFELLLADRLSKSGKLASRHSQRAYRDDVRRFNAWRKARPITKSLIEEYLAELSTDRKSPAYLARSLAAIRWYIRAVKDLLYDNEAVKAAVHRLPAGRQEEMLKQIDRALDAQKPRGERAAGIEKGRYVPVQEFEALIDACLADDTYAGARDQAMFALAYSTGPRVHEVAGLNFKDIIPVKEGELMYKVRIIGKGNKERQVAPRLVGGAAQYMQEWLRVRGTQPGALFCYITRPGENSGAKGHLSRIERHLSTFALGKILEKRRLQAGLEELTWHDFRRTYISDLIRKFDLVTAQKIVGHSSPNVTSVYDRSWQDKAEEAARLRAISYKSRGGNEDA